MKKIILCLLLCVISLSIFAFNQNNTKILADNTQSIVVIGKGEAEGIADTANLHFSIVVNDAFDNGHTKILNICNCICNSVKEIDENSECSNGFYTCFPRCHGGICNYEFATMVTIKTTKLDKIDEIVKTAINCGATSYDGVIYTLENKDELITTALTIAKQNAFEKAKVLNDNCEIAELKESNIQTFERNGKITIQAFIKAKFNVNQTPVKTQTDDDNPINSEKEDDNLSSSFFTASFNNFS